MVKALVAGFVLIAMILLSLGLAMIVGLLPATFILGGLFFAAVAYSLWRVKRR